MLCFQSQKEYKLKLNLLDDRKFQFKYKGYQKCQQLMEDTAKLLDLNETEYFGFRYVDTDKQMRWIILNRNFQSQFKSLSDDLHSNESVEVSVFFCIKFYATDPCKLNDESTRYLFYLQLKKDIWEGRLTIQFELAVDLFGYFLQGELGDYSSIRDKQGYASQFDFTPEQTIELEKAAEIKHSKLKGMSCSLAEESFLNIVKWLDMYGVELQHVLDENGIEFSIGITPTGIVVYENGIKKSNYFWPRIRKLNFKLNKFILTVIEKENVEKSQVFYLANKKLCKSLWINCMEHHKYFRMKTVYEKPAKLKATLITSKQPRSGENTSKVLIKRVPAKRKNRRQIDDEPDINHMNKMKLNENIKIENENLVFLPMNNDKSNDLTKKHISPEAESIKSIDSHKYSKKRESGSEKEFEIRHRSGSRNRSRIRHSYVQEKETYSENHNKNSDETEQNERYALQHQRRRSHHRSHSRGSTKTSHPEWPSLVHGKSRKSLTDNNSGANLLKNDIRKKFPEISDHETTLDEEKINEIERKRQIRRRKRSKSPGASIKPPNEILQHIKYNLVEPSEQLSSDQLKEIPFVKIETKAPAFRISPHQKQKRYSPFKQRSCDVSEFKSNIDYMRDGNAQIVKTRRIIDYGDKNHSDQRPLNYKSITAGSAINTKLIINSDKTVTYIAFSDSGCEEMTNK